MKRMFALFVILLLCVSSLTACADPQTPDPADNKLKIIATVFPAYDWTRNVLGDESGRADLSLLLDTGADMHSFQPSASDILKISSCDLLIHVGGLSDAWIEDALKEAVNPDMTVICLLDVLGEDAKEESFIDGMQDKEHEGHDHEEPEYDEHVFLSLRNAVRFTEAIAEALGKKDAGRAAAYEANARSYVNKLQALDRSYEEAVSEGRVRTLLFGDRFPFRYLAEDYGLSCYAAFSGCSAETEASFETITFLASKVDELSLRAVMTIDGSDRKIAQTIVRNTRTKDQQILTLDSMQAVPAKDIAEGVTYLSVMEKNLGVLKEALR